MAGLLKFTLVYRQVVPRIQLIHPDLSKLLIGYKLVERKRYIILVAYFHAIIYLG